MFFEVKSCLKALKSSSGFHCCGVQTNFTTFESFHLGLLLWRGLTPDHLIMINAGIDQRQTVTHRSRDYRAQRGIVLNTMDSIHRSVSLYLVQKC